MPLAQTWHTRPEFYELYNCFITVALKCSSQVASPDPVPVSGRGGQASHRGLRVLRKSGQVRNEDLTIIQHGGRCPDLSGSAGAFLIGHETKKDIPMLNI
jgi:hypothetical protein